MQRFLILAVILCVWSGTVLGQSIPDSRYQINLSFSPVVKKVTPAVVNIYTRRVVQQRAFSPLLNDPFFREFFGQSLPHGLTRERVEKSLGSGVIVSADGLIVTNAHVIKNAQEITVGLSDRREFPATVVSNDPRTDLAVLRISPGKDPLPYLIFQDSDQVQVGDLVLAIGNPFGVGQTVTSGIVSALARTEVGVSDFNFFIQTDAAINPGNSGGALVTMSGQLAGINSAIYSRSGGSLGIGFAIPSNMVQTVVQAAKDGGKSIVRPWMGAEGQPVTSDLAASLGLPRPAGVLVNGLHPQSPALKAGLKIGDVITAVNDHPVDDIGSLRFRVATLPVSGEATLHLIRDGKEQAITVDLKGPPEMPARDTRVLKGDNPLTGITAVNISPAVSEELRLDNGKEGVAISVVDPESPAARLGFATGDILEALNNQKITDTAKLADLLEQPRRTWQIRLRRGAQVTNVVVRG